MNGDYNSFTEIPLRFSTDGCFSPVDERGAGGWGSMARKGLGSIHDVVTGERRVALFVENPRPINTKRTKMQQTHETRGY